MTEGKRNIIHQLLHQIVFIDAIRFSVRDEHIVKKIAAYIILGINDEGKKGVLSITVGETKVQNTGLGCIGFAIRLNMCQIKTKRHLLMN